MAQHERPYHKRCAFPLPGEFHRHPSSISKVDSGVKTDNAELKLLLSPGTAWWGDHLSAAGPEELFCPGEGQLGCRGKSKLWL